MINDQSPDIQIMRNIFFSDSSFYEPIQELIMKEISGNGKHFKWIREGDTLYSELNLSDLALLQTPSNFNISAQNINNSNAIQLLEFFSKVMKETCFNIEQNENKHINYSFKIISNNNYVSGYSLVGLGYVDREPIDLTRIEHVEYCKTLVSNIGLSKINQLVNLKTLNIDYCPKITELLKAEAPLHSLEKLSMVGVGIALGASEMTTIETYFPNLVRMDYTPKVNNNTKLLGIKDPSSYQTIVGPILYSCGHLVSNAYKSKNECYFHCKSEQIGLFEPLMSRLEKLDGRWTVRLIDFKRNPLSERKFYHNACGNLFNIETVEEILLVKESSDEHLITEAKGKPCIGCAAKDGIERPLNIMKVHFDEVDIMDSDEASQTKKTLAEIDEYTAINVNFSSDLLKVMRFNV